MQQRGYGAPHSRAQPVLHAGAGLPAPQKLLDSVQLGMPLPFVLLPLQLVKEVLSNRLQMRISSVWSHELREHASSVAVLLQR